MGKREAGWKNVKVVAFVDHTNSTFDEASAANQAVLEVQISTANHSLHSAHPANLRRGRKKCHRVVQVGQFVKCSCKHVSHYS